MNALVDASSPGHPTRRWRSSGRTRQTILDAAKELFSDLGYEQTNISDVVERSGVSVGSIYHHVGGKAAIFEAVATEVIRSQATESRQAIELAKERGVNDPVDLYLAGARAYLLATWHHRQVTKAMLGDNRPAGFGRVEQSLMRRMSAGTKDITLGFPPTGTASGRAVTAILRAAADELFSVESEESADDIVAYFIGLLRRLAGTSAAGSIADDPRDGSTPTADDPR